MTIVENAQPELSGHSAPPWLAAEQLSCERGNRQLFEHLNFQLLPGQVLQVEGANGSGKTSLLRMLCGLALPASGQLLWQGEPLQENRAEYLTEVAYVGHNQGIKGDLTALENLQMLAALGSRRNGMDPREALQRLGMEGYGHTYCQRMSAGQRRRVALAGLLITRAKLWLLDEPFTAIDRQGIRSVTRLLIEHVAAGGILAMTTHHEVSFQDHPVIHLQLGP